MEITDPSTIQLVAALPANNGPTVSVRGHNVPEATSEVDNTPPLPAPLANTLIDAITSLGQMVQKLDERMANVESLAARQSVAPPAPPVVPVPDEAEVQDSLRESMWKRANLRLKGVEPESFLPDTPPAPAPARDPLCKTCHTNKRHGPSKYCLPCLQEQNRDRCGRCGNVVPDVENGCATCAAEARVLERVKPGVRHPVGEMSYDVVDMIAEGFPA